MTRRATKSKRLWRVRAYDATGSVVDFGDLRTPQVRSTVRRIEQYLTESGAERITVAPNRGWSHEDGWRIGSEVPLEEWDPKAHGGREK